MKKHLINLGMSVWMWDKSESVEKDSGPGVLLVQEGGLMPEAGFHRQSHIQNWSIPDQQGTDEVSEALQELGATQSQSYLCLSVVEIQSLHRQTL